MALSDIWLKANSGRTRAKREEHADRDGLSVRVTPKGKIIFQTNQQILLQQVYSSVGSRGLASRHGDYFGSHGQPSRDLVCRPPPRGSNLIMEADRVELELPDSLETGQP